METNRLEDSGLRSGEALDVRLAVSGGRSWLFLVPSMVLMVGVGLADRRPFGFWGAIVLAIIFVALFVLQIVRTVLRNRAGTIMILNADGVTVGSNPLVRWSDIDRIVVCPVAGFFPATLMFGSVVGFVPKPGVVMPPPPGGYQVSPERQAAWQQARLQRYGTNLTVVPS